MPKVITFEEKNANAAAIDIGAKKIFVSCDGATVKSYDTFTQSYRQCIGDLKQQGVKRVCMEATGVYWIALYQMLEAAGMEVCLVNPKEVKQVKGRKTDVPDACWIQKMFSAGLVRQSYIPEGKLKELRMLMTVTRLQKPVNTPNASNVKARGPINVAKGITKMHVQ